MNKDNENMEDVVVNRTNDLGSFEITPRATDFSAWYQDIVFAAGLAEHGPVRGTMVIKPYGYALWEKIQKYIDGEFKKHGISNAYFPMLIPEKFLKKEESHVEGFAPEVAVVTHAGGSKLEEPLIIRPTSETIIYDTYSRWIRSYRDLPLLINQWANVVRWEMRPRLFLRTTEFLWQEGHTVHETMDEADIFAKKMLDVYAKFAKEVMAIPTMPGEKSESERFAGASKTYTVEAMMQDGKALQFATSHNLGQNFSKAFDVKFLNQKNEYEYGYQTSFGLSTRSIGGLIMTHSDDKGLVLPPNIAPIQVVIVPIWKDQEGKDKVLSEANKIKDTLEENEISVKLDERDLRPGEKYYEWERKGVPLRIEIGLRDIENNSIVIVARDQNEKQIVKIEAIEKIISEQLNTMQNRLFVNAEKYRDEKIIIAKDWEDCKKAFDNGNFVKVNLALGSENEKKIKEETKATVRCIVGKSKGKCVYSGVDCDTVVILARSY